MSLFGPLRTSARKRFPLWWLGIILSALTVFALLNLSPRVEAGRESKSFSSDSFVLYRNARGELACRSASADERRTLTRDDPSELHQINHPELLAGAGNQPATNDLPQHLTIILRATNQLNNFPTAKAAFISAAQNWESLVKSPVTIYIDVDFGPTFFGDPWPEDVLGATDSPTITRDYPSVRAQLIAGASNSAETTIYNSLPSPRLPTDRGSSNLVMVPAANARALGLLDPTAPDPNISPSTPRASVGFNSDFDFDFNPNNGIGFFAVDFDAVATHEIGHVLGFHSESGGDFNTPGIWDLFRFRTGTTTNTFPTANRIMSIGGPFSNPAQRYFVPGNPELGLSTGGPEGSESNNGDGSQSSHWEAQDLNDGVLIGIMDPSIASGVRRTIHANDIEALNIFGYSLESNIAPPPPPPDLPAPGNNNFANPRVISDCTGSVLGSTLASTRETGEPSHDPAGTTGGGSVWYQWQSPVNGSVTMSTVGNQTNFDTVLAVYTGNDVSTLVTIVKNDDINSGIVRTSRVTFTATAGVTYRIAIDGWGGLIGDFVLNWTSSCAAASVQLSQSSVTVNEGAGFAAINISRSGDTSRTASVTYATTDATDVNFNCHPFTPGQVTGVASRKCDYHIASGRVRFAPGETVKTINISIVDDVFFESSEILNITLSNSNSATLGTNSSANITITDNDLSGQPNPIDGTNFLVRMLYVDLLSREPDPVGFQGWVDRIDKCGQPGQPPPPCDRVTVSGDGFLRSAEFFDREFFVIRLYRTGLGRILRYDDVGDLAYVSGFLTSADLELNKQELVSEIMSRPEFSNIYNSLSNEQFVDTLIQTAAVTIPSVDRDAWVNALNGGTRTRAVIYREISERAEVSNKYLHEAQVVSCYYGFFTRNPDAAYFSYLQRLDNGEITLGDLANAFINAAEYRQRFGP
jgi:Calx-beta domain